MEPGVQVSVIVWGREETVKCEVFMQTLTQYLRLEHIIILYYDVFVIHRSLFLCMKQDWEPFKLS